MGGNIGSSLPDREDGVTLQQVADALATAWCRETAVKKNEWVADNPSWGQCLATALMIRRLFGGKIMKTTVRIPDDIKWPGDRPREYRHYYNELETGEGVDLTATQFPLNSKFHVSKQMDEPRTRGTPFGMSTVKQAIFLEKRVYAVLGVDWGRSKGYISPGEEEPGMTPVEAAPGLVVARSKPVGR